MNVRLPLLLLTCVGLAACDPITMGLVTAGGGVAVNHQMSATITRTFSNGAQDVQSALLAALGKMSITVTHREQRGEVQVISGTAGTRAVSMRVEPVTRTSTLLEVAVHQDVLTMDGATAREIVAQTEQALSLAGNPLVVASASPASKATAGTHAASGDSLPGRTTYYGHDSDTPRSTPAKPRERSSAAVAGSTTGSGNTAGSGSSARARPLNPSQSQSGSAPALPTASAPQALLPAQYSGRSLAAATTP